MSIGSRISELRKENNFSQEYVAGQLGVSRQAVSKWEKDLSSPDTNNLINLASLLGTTVEYIASGKTPDAPPAPQYIITEKRKRIRKLTKKGVIKIFISAFVFLIVGMILLNHFAPVEWDALACGGGYATDVFDKYSEELVQKYITGSADADKITNIHAVRGTQSAEWSGRKIHLSFDIQYEQENIGTVTETLRCMGTRVWTERYIFDFLAIDLG